MLLDQGFWTVDDITPGKAINERLAEQMLLRMVHASHDRPGGIRYLLVHRDCVDIRHTLADDQSPKFSYGLAYNLVHQQLSESVEEINYGTVTARTPVVTVENLSRCVERRYDAERQLRTDLAEILTGLEEIRPPERGERSPEIERGRKPSWSIRIHVVNVGQGDTIILEFPGRRLWIIDAYFWSKSRYDGFREWLDETLPGHVIEKAIISHCHYDHIRSMDKVITDLSPQEVLAADVPTPPPNQTTNNVLAAARQRGVLRMIRQVEDVDVGLARVRLYPTTSLPGDPALGQDPNEHGIIVAVKTDKSMSLLPGDAPGRLLGPLVHDSFFDGDMASRFYKVTHHCSRTGDDDVFLRGFMANNAVTSCSRVNRYGHPHNPPEQKIAANARASPPRGRHRKTYEEDMVLTYALP